VGSQTLSTTESIVIDGANGITHATREGFPDAPVSLGVFVLGVLAAAALLRRAPKWVPLVLGLAALPGLFHVVWARADAPPHRAATAGTVDASLSAITGIVKWPTEKILVTREDDGVTFPLSRYAVPSRPPVSDALQLEVKDTTLPLWCSKTAAVVSCGAPP
jgi:hypothetical protein